MRLGPKGLIGLGRPKALVNVGGGRLQGASGPPGTPAIVALIAGQSNAAATNGSGAPPNFTPDGNTLIWSGSAFATYAPNVNSEYGDTPASSWGPEAQALYRLRQANPAARIYLIKYAKGSTSIASQAGALNDWNPATADELFAAMSATVATARAAIASDGYDNSIDVAWWIQGEQDANIDQPTADAYQTNLTAFIAKARLGTGSGGWSIGDSPIVISRLADTTTWPYRAAVRAAQSAVVAADPTRLFIVNADDLATDGTHYTVAGLTTLGDRLYDAPTAAAPASNSYNSADKAPSINLANSNCSVSRSSAVGGWQAVRSLDTHTAGLWYVEHTITAGATHTIDDQISVGIANAAWGLNAFIGEGGAGNSGGAWSPGDWIFKENFTANARNFARSGNTRVVRMKIDLSGAVPVLSLAVDAGTFQNFTMTAAASGPWMVGASMRDGGPPFAALTTNFGASLFTYAVPAGFKSWDGN